MYQNTLISTAAAKRSKLRFSRFFNTAHTKRIDDYVIYFQTVKQWRRLKKITHHDLKVPWNKLIGFQTERRWHRLNLSSIPNLLLGSERQLQNALIMLDKDEYARQIANYNRWWAVSCEYDVYVCVAQVTIRFLIC